MSILFRSIDRYKRSGPISSVYVRR